MTVYRVVILVVSFVWATATNATAGAFIDLKDQPVTIGVSRTFHSEILGEDRELFVSLPRNYDRDQDRTFPLYLTMDARSMFAPAAAIIGSLSSAGEVPEMIVVSSRIRIAGEISRRRV